MTTSRTISTADLIDIADLVTNAQGAQETLGRLLYASAQEEEGEAMAAEVWTLTALGEKLEQISEALGALIASSTNVHTHQITDI